MEENSLPSGCFWTRFASHSLDRSRKNILSLACSNAVQGVDSSHHRLSDKVNCDLTLRRISGLFPAIRVESIVVVSCIFLSTLSLIPQSRSTFRVLHAASTLCGGKPYPVQSEISLAGAPGRSLISCISQSFTHPESTLHGISKKGTGDRRVAC